VKRASAVHRRFRPSSNPACQISDMPGWFGLFAPKATPDAIVDRIAGATHMAMADPALQETYRAQGMEPDINSGPDKFQRLVEDELARLTPVIKSIGLKRDRGGRTSSSVDSSTASTAEKRSPTAHSGAFVPRRSNSKTLRRTSEDAAPADAHIRRNQTAT
jgi:hypothetical protein